MSAQVPHSTSASVRVGASTRACRAPSVRGVEWGCIGAWATAGTVDASETVGSERGAVVPPQAVIRAKNQHERCTAPPHDASCSIGTRGRAPMPDGRTAVAKAPWMA